MNQTKELASSIYKSFLSSNSEFIFSEIREERKIYTSFLHFVSDSYNDNSIYPYWSDLTHKEKYKFTYTIKFNFSSLSKKTKNIILHERSNFWKYMSEIINIQLVRGELNFADHIYIQESISSIFIILENNEIFPSIAKDVNRLAKCQEFCEYMQKLFNYINGVMLDQRRYLIPMVDENTITKAQFTESFAKFYGRISKNINMSL